MPNITHSRKAFFSVRCTALHMQEAIRKRLTNLRDDRILSCVIVSPDTDARGQHLPSRSAGSSAKKDCAPSIRAPSFSHLRWFNLPPEAPADADYVESDPADDDDEEEKVVVVEDEKKNEPVAIYSYDVYLEAKTKPFGKSSKKWPQKLFIVKPRLEGVVAVSAPSSLDDNTIVSYMRRLHVIEGRPTLDRAATLNFLAYKFPSGDQTVPSIQQKELVKTAIAEYYYAPYISKNAREEIYQLWRADLDAPPTPRRLQAERCSLPDELRAADPLHWRHPFFTGTKAPRFKWTSQHLGAPTDRKDYKAMVLIGPVRTGKTQWARNLGPHIYMHRTLNNALIHDCVADGVAKYIVIDDVDWGLLFNTASIGPALLGAQRSFTWKRGRDTITTEVRLPVIVLKDHLPTSWGKSGETNWRKNLQIIQLSGKPLYDTSVDLLAAQPSSSSPSSSPVPSSSPSSSPAPYSSPSSSPVPPPHFPDVALLPVEKVFVKGLPNTWVMCDVITPAAEALLNEEIETQGGPWIEFVTARTNTPLSRLKKLQCFELAFGWVVWYKYPDARPMLWRQFTALMARLCTQLQTVCAEPINSCVINKYRDESDKIGPHQDKCDSMVMGSSIVTLSTGPTARTVQFTEIDGPGKVTLVLPPRSLYSIGWQTNQLWAHEVLEEKGPTNVRYGLTFRSIASVFHKHTETYIQRPIAGHGSTWDVLKYQEDIEDGSVDKITSYKTVQRVHPADPTRLQAADLEQVSAAAQREFGRPTPRVVTNKKRKKPERGAVKEKKKPAEKKRKSRKKAAEAEVEEKQEQVEEEE